MQRDRVGREVHPLHAELRQPIEPLREHLVLCRRRQDGKLVRPQPRRQAEQAEVEGDVGLAALRRLIADEHLELPRRDERQAGVSKHGGFAREARDAATRADAGFLQTAAQVLARVRRHHPGPRDRPPPARELHHASRPRTDIDPNATGHRTSLLSVEMPVDSLATPVGAITFRSLSIYLIRYTRKTHDIRQRKWPPRQESASQILCGRCGRSFNGVPWRHDVTYVGAGPRPAMWGRVPVPLCGGGSPTRPGERRTTTHSIERQGGRSADWHANQPTCPYTNHTCFGTVTPEIASGLTLPKPV